MANIPSTLTIFSKRKNPTTERAPTRPMWTVRWCCSWWCSPPAINQCMPNCQYMFSINQLTTGNRRSFLWWCSPPAINQCMPNCQYMFSVNQLTSRRSFSWWCWWCSPPAINQWVCYYLFTIKSISAGAARDDTFLLQSIDFVSVHVLNQSINFLQVLLVMMTSSCN